MECGQRRDQQLRCLRGFAGNRQRLDGVEFSGAAEGFDMFLNYLIGSERRLVRSSPQKERGECKDR